MQRSSRSIFAAALVAAVAFFALASTAQAQRLSLAERVAKLEQDAQSHNGQGNIDLVNQINALQSQVQTLQGQVEELRHQVDEMRSRSKEQYIDLDSRIGRLEGRGNAPAASAPPPAPNNGQLQDVPLGAPGAAPPANAAPSANTAPPPDANLAPPAANPADEKSSYDQALAALKDGRYAESSRRFQAFITQYPNSELVSNAYYWLGESYYVTANYPIALNTFQKLLAQYPNSAKVTNGDALLKVGYCQYELKQWDQAEATLNDVVQKYPNSIDANLAQGRLRALKMEARQR